MSECTERVRKIAHKVNSDVGFCKVHPYITPYNSYLRANKTIEIPTGIHSQPPGSLAPLPIPQGLIRISGISFVFSASFSLDTVYGFTPNKKPAKPPALSTFRNIVILSAETVTSSAIPVSAPHGRIISILGFESRFRYQSAMCPQPAMQ